jgi:hypothetical protein
MQMSAARRNVYVAHSQRLKPALSMPLPPHDRLSPTGTFPPQHYEVGLAALAQFLPWVGVGPLPLQTIPKRLCFRLQSAGVHLQTNSVIVMNKEELISVAADCPNGHRYAWKYAHGRLRELLDSGTLMFYRYKCDTHFPPTQEAILNLRKQVAGR